MDQYIVRNFFLGGVTFFTNPVNDSAGHHFTVVGGVKHITFMILLTVVAKQVFRALVLVRKPRE